MTSTQVLNVEYLDLLLLKSLCLSLSVCQLCSGEYFGQLLFIPTESQRCAL